LAPTALLDAAFEDRPIRANPARGVTLPELSAPEVVPPWSPAEPAA
jgi:hypothetical protein